MKQGRNGKCRTHTEFIRVFLRPGIPYLWCSLCKDYVELGPAKDSTVVRVEIRAMEIVDLLVGTYVNGKNPIPQRLLSLDEHVGWRARRQDQDFVDPQHYTKPLKGWIAARWSGWLARDIVHEGFDVGA